MGTPTLTGSLGSCLCKRPLRYPRNVRLREKCLATRIWQWGPVGNIGDVGSACGGDVGDASGNIRVGSSRTRDLEELCVAATLAEAEPSAKQAEDDLGPEADS